MFFCKSFQTNFTMANTIQLKQNLLFGQDFSETLVKSHLINWFITFD